MTVAAVIEYIEQDVRIRPEPAEMRTPALVQEYMQIHASGFPESEAESRTLAARLLHARLDRVVTELRARYVLD